MSGLTGRQECLPYARSLLANRDRSRSNPHYSMDPEAPRTISPVKVRRICRRAAFLILTLGLSSAAVIWPSHPSPADSDTIPGFLSPDDAARYQRQVEIYYGKSGVLVERWTRAASQLTHGKGLAETLALISIAGAAGAIVGGWLLTRGR